MVRWVRALYPAATYAVSATNDMRMMTGVMTARTGARTAPVRMMTMTPDLLAYLEPDERELLRLAEASADARKLSGEFKQIGNYERNRRFAVPGEAERWWRFADRAAALEQEVARLREALAESDRNRELALSNQGSVMEIGFRSAMRELEAEVARLRLLTAETPDPEIADAVAVMEAAVEGVVLDEHERAALEQEVARLLDEYAYAVAILLEENELLRHSPTRELVPKDE